MQLFVSRNLGGKKTHQVILLLQSQSHNLFFVPKFMTQNSDTWTNPLWNCFVNLFACFSFVYIFSLSWIAADNQDGAGKLHAAQALASNKLEQIEATVVLIRHCMNKIQLNWINKSNEYHVVHQILQHSLVYYPYLTAYIWWTCLFMATHSTRVWMSFTIEGMWKWKPLFCHCKCIKTLQYL